MRARLKTPALHKLKQTYPDGSVQETVFEIQSIDLGMLRCTALLKEDGAVSVLPDSDAGGVVAIHGRVVSTRTVPQRQRRKP